MDSRSARLSISDMPWPLPVSSTVEEKITNKKGVLHGRFVSVVICGQFSFVNKS